jgi:dihydrodipicolinate synthase/N-acetylneuraminate lyase
VAYQLGASHPCPHTALERLRRGRDYAPGAFQVILADWWPTRMEDAIRCLERFAAVADPIPLVLYNPPHAKRVFTADEVRQLKAAVPALIGCKGTQYEQLLPDGVPGLALFAGGRVLADAWPKGARGAYSEVACMNPWGAVRWYELMTRDLPAAQEIGRRLTAWRARHIVPLNQQLGFAGPYNDKLFAAIGDWAPIGTRMRWPYRGVEPALAASLRPAARAEVPEIFAAQP